MATPATRSRSLSRGWLWIALAWGSLGLFDASQTVFAMRAEGMHHAWTRLFITHLLFWFIWALSTPLILKLAAQHPLMQGIKLTAWLWHLAAVALITVAAAGWSAFLEELLNPMAANPPRESLARLWRDNIYDGILSSLILYSSVLAVSYVLASRERIAHQQTETARLNEQLSKAQLDALRRQIEPHFLFNSLNAIAGLVREKRNDDAVNMIAGLSDFLRRVLEGSHEQEVALGEELEFLQKYLEIQKARFAERLQVSVEVPHELKSARVPSLILQPMVENAVKHGIAKRAQGGEIRICASHSNGTLTLSVYNDGPKLPTNGENAQAGIGMTNVRTRLRSLYGDEFELSMRDRVPTGVEVTISLPFSGAVRAIGE